MGQHYVPRKYLRGFCEPGSDSMLWQYDKNLDRFARVSVVTAANERGFYSDAVESKLAEHIEEPANVAIENLRQRRAISSKQRAHLSLYIATMMKRVPKHRARGHAMLPGLLESTVSEVKGLINRAADEGHIDLELCRKKIAEADLVAERFRQNPPAQVIDQIRTPWPIEEMVELIFSMTWRVCMVQGSNLFVTCDNPACFFEHCGLRGDEAELVFPIASDLALHACWQPLTYGEHECRMLPPYLLKEFNRRLAGACHRFVYYHREAQWIRTITRKIDPFLSIIRWSN